MSVDRDQDIDNFVDLFDNNLDAAQAALQKRIIERNRTPTVSNSSGDNRSTREIVIRLVDVSKTYKLNGAHINALKNVTLDLHKGEFIAITGSSGSGKSTLLQVIGCLDNPTSGKIHIGKDDISSLSDTKLSELRQKRLGFVFQSFYLQPFLNLQDNIAVPAMFTNIRKDVLNERVITLLNQVGLYEYRKRIPKELSGGQIQRAAIARSLVNIPDVILADEPTGNLDSANSQVIVDIFKQVQRKLGTTIIVVTHDEKIASQADRVIKLQDGAVV